MTVGAQKTFIKCPECSEQVLVVIPEGLESRGDGTASCSKGHAFEYDERAVLSPASSSATA